MVQQLETAQCIATDKLHEVKQTLVSVVLTRPSCDRSQTSDIMRVEQNHLCCIPTVPAVLLLPQEAVQTFVPIGSFYFLYSVLITKYTHSITITVQELIHLNTQHLFPLFIVDSCSAAPPSGWIYKQHKVTNKPNHPTKPCFMFCHSM